MKKLWSFLFVAILIITVLTGCTGQATTQAAASSTTASKPAAPAGTPAASAPTAGPPPATGASPKPSTPPAATSVESTVTGSGLPAGLSRAPGASKTELLYWDKTNAYNGYTLFGSGGTWLLDMEGNVVNKWNTGNNPELLANGNILDTAGAGPDIGASWKEMDWDSKTVWSYTETRKGYSPHHDWAKIYNPKLKQETFMYIANKSVTQDEAIAAGADPKTGPYSGAQMDTITEVDLKGNIIWEWRFFDHLIQDLDATKANYVGQGKKIADYPGRLNINLSGRPVRQDWLHCNAMDYNEELDQVVINSGPGEFYVIDHGNTFTPGDPAGSMALAAGPKGDFLYRFGDPARYNQGKAALPGSGPNHKQIGGAHDIQWIKPGLPGAGNFLVFNNGQSLFEDIPQSYIFEINPFLDAKKNNTGKYVNPPDAGYYTWTPINDKSTMKRAKQMSNQIVYIYATKDNTALFSHIGSGAQRLPNGNLLICADTTGHIFEVTKEGMLVWDYINPVFTTYGILDYVPDSYPMENPVFRAYRYGPDYPGLKGKTLTPKGGIAANYSKPAGGAAAPAPGAVPGDPGAAAAPTAGATTGKAPPAKPASSGKLVVTSSVVKEAGNMPDKYTRTGAKAGLTTVSPPIAWSGAPAGTQSLVVIGSGVSTDGNEEIHWILYNVPGTTASLAEDVKGVGTVGQAFITPSEGAMGTYKKTITIYALSANITLSAADSADVSKVRAAMEGKVLDTGSLNYEFTVG